MSKSKKVDDKYNFCYMYWLLNEMSKCVHDGYKNGSAHRYKLSKIVPKLEKILEEMCNESGNY